MKMVIFPENIPFVMEKKEKLVITEWALEDLSLIHISEPTRRC